MKTYEQFLSLIKEGLITTHNIYNIYSSLEINLRGIGFDIELNILDKFRYEITINNPLSFLDEDMYELFFKYNENLGYYPINFKILRENNKQNTLNFFTTKLVEETDNKKKQKVKQVIINNFDVEIKKNNKEIVILFDAKYDDSLYKNDVDIPDIVYHLSPVKNRNSIKRNGLYPKSFSRKINHRERIYVFTEIDNYVNILKSLKLNDLLDKNIELKYDLYEIELDKNKNILHTDVDSMELSGFFTYDSLSPKKIKIVKEDL